MGDSDYSFVDERNYGIMKVTVNVGLNGQGKYLAVCPDLSGCCASGESRIESITKIETVIRGYLGSLNRSVPRNLKKVIMVSGRTAVPTNANLERGKRER